MNILLVGSCGVGKTWIMKRLIEHYSINRKYKIGKFYFHANDRIAIVGKYDGTTFEGSDRLSMSVITDIDKFLEVVQREFIIFEGDRFTNSTFIKTANPYIIKITGDGYEGRVLRGSKQTERHIKSIATRVSKIKADAETGNSIHALTLIENLLDDSKKI